MFEGWTLVTRPDATNGGDNCFEIWNSGDRMSDVNGTLRTVNAAPNDGNDWLEINNAGGDMNQLAYRDIVNKSVI